MLSFLKQINPWTNKAFASTDSYTNFIERFPEYERTSSLNTLRQQDFARLDEQEHTYLDFTGGQLYGESLLHQHHEFLKNKILGNPHSINPSSSLAERHVEASRKKVLEYFNAGDDYICVFTANASSAIKLVAESYPFTENSQLLLTADNHNSVNGMREYARKAGGAFTYTELTNELLFDQAELSANLESLNGNEKLFAFPAQSNVSGVKHDLNWIDKAQANGWDVLLDAAAYVPTSPLDLSRHQPNFVSLSFYKMFGYPTGLGALLVKKDTFNKLQKLSFAGGTITIVSVNGDGHYLESEAARFEDGTINYLDIPAIKTGLEYIESIGLSKIELRVRTITHYLMEQLLALRHQNGQNLIRIYGPEGMENRGGTLVMNFYDRDGQLHDFQQIESDAYKKNISIRTGCFCNPGIDEKNHNLNKEKLKAYFKRGGEKNYFDLIRFLDQKRGAVRISVGFITDYKDAQVFIAFCKSYLNKKVAQN
ncbi:aminotransferase class V-fold PLP-dependent enzyme [Roseivirga sp.]|uniref:aminotransferase class V-fold PLP-dependent enzyme n=1 Tax=Roseivirga sp. TaxID=1964215 RepID=UPI003B52C4A8